MTTTTDAAERSGNKTHFYLGLVALLIAALGIGWGFYRVITALNDPWVGTRPFVAGIVVAFAVGLLLEKINLWAMLAGIAVYHLLVEESFREDASLGVAAVIVAGVLVALAAVTILRLVRSGLLKRDKDGDVAAGDDDEEPEVDRLIVGLSGYAGVGKDTAAEALIALGWTRVSFADKLRAFALAQNPFIPVVVPAISRKPEDQIETWMRLSEFLESCGGDWTLAKKNLEVRRLLQTTGTEAGRTVIGENVWVDAVMKDLPEGNIVFTDMRFDNEYQAIVSQPGGLAVRINRPGHEPVNPHVSETSLDDHLFHGVIDNTGSRSRLQAALVSFCSAYEPDA